MSILSKSKVGWKYSQWRRSLRNWTDYWYVKTRITPWVSAPYLQPIRQDERGNQLRLMTMTLSRQSADGPEEFYEYYLKIFQQIQLDPGFETEDIQFHEYKPEDFEKAAKELEEQNKMMLSIDDITKKINEGILEKVLAGSEGETFLADDLIPEEIEIIRMH